MKGIIVVDKPDKCEWCRFGYIAKNNGVVRCMVTHKEVDDIEKPAWCPIKPIPQKKKKYGIDARRVKSYKNGWNACVDEMMGDSDG